jgi:hypothetical protein
VKYEEGEQIAQQNGLMFMETSAKSGHNVAKVRDPPLTAAFPNSDIRDHRQDQLEQD